MAVMHIPGHDHQRPREVTLEEVRAVLGDCRLCPLGETRTNLVFGVGNPHARVMFIGEAPGRNEDLQGEPFVGAAGHNLDSLLSLAGLRREDIYIANVLKCRPPQNRDPLPEEEDACIDYLRAQVKLIDPKVIVCLGRIAAGYIIDPNFKMMKQHGQWFEKDGRLMMGMLHPAAVLRNPNQRPVAFADFVTLRNKAEEICTRTQLVYPE